MIGHRPLLASILAATLLVTIAPTASADSAPTAACQQLFYGPDIDSGICYDVKGEDCLVWIYNNYGRDTCIVPAVTLGFGEICRQVLVGPDIDQGVCVRPGASSCRIEWYDNFGNGGFCLA